MEPLWGCSESPMHTWRTLFICFPTLLVVGLGVSWQRLWNWSRFLLASVSPSLSSLPLQPPASGPSAGHTGVLKEEVPGKCWVQSGAQEVVLKQGSPTPRPRTLLLHGLLGTSSTTGSEWQAASKLHPWLQSLPNHSQPRLSSASCQIRGVRFSQELKPYRELQVQGI